MNAELGILSDAHPKHNLQSHTSDEANVGATFRSGDRSLLALNRLIAVIPYSHIRGISPRSMSNLALGGVLGVAKSCGPSVRTAVESMNHL
jgi:hypothetical protein